MDVVGERQVRTRHRALMRRIGEELRGAREDSGLTQAEIGRRAGVTRSHVSRIEMGLAAPSIEVLQRIAVALGADLAVRLFPNTGLRVRDRISVPMTQALLRDLHPRWGRRAEVAVYRPVRGVIDLVLEDRGSPETAVTEIQSQIRRVEQLVRWHGQKADALASQPDQAGRRVTRLLVLRNTQANRDIARAASEMLGVAYPSRTLEAVAALRGEAPWPGAAVVWMVVEGGRAALMDAPPRGVELGR